MAAEDVKDEGSGRGTRAACAPFPHTSIYSKTQSVTMPLLVYFCRLISKQACPQRSLQAPPPPRKPQVLLLSTWAQGPFVHTSIQGPSLAVDRLLSEASTRSRWLGLGLGLESRRSGPSCTGEGRLPSNHKSSGLRGPPGEGTVWLGRRGE